MSLLVCQLGQANQLLLITTTTVPGTGQPIREEMELLIIFVLFNTLLPKSLFCKMTSKLLKICLGYLQLLVVF